MHLNIIILFLSIIQFISTEEIIYKQCKDSGFCQRCRNIKSYSEIYNLLLNTLQIYPDSITCELYNIKANNSLILKLKAIQNETFQLQIDEKSPLHSRYRVAGALKDQPITRNIKVLIESEYELIVTSDKNKAVITVSPFRIDFYRQDIVILSINGKGLMHFEQLRHKPNKTIDEFNSTMDDTTENSNSGEWEDFFLGALDSKPNGPEAISLDFSFPQAYVLFGIPQHSDSFILKSTIDDEPYRLYNLDIAKYKLNNRMAMYGSVPILYGHGWHSTVGVFWHNSAETWIDIYKKSELTDLVDHNKLKEVSAAHFMSESGIIDVFILLGPKPLDTFKQYTDLTGTTNLPQLCTLGYHQSCWNYEYETDIISMSNSFDKFNIPMDTIWLDLEYINNKEIFTWDPFEDPLSIINYLTKRGRHLTILLGPHIKISDKYNIHNDSEQFGYYVKTKYGISYKGWTWSGIVSFLDFFNPDVQKYWSDNYQINNAQIITNDIMIWNYMNEPSVYSGPEGTMNKDNLHYKNIEHRNVHNLYSHMNIMSQFNNMIKYDPNQRPFILTRSHFAGSQRYAAISMGDNSANWDYLKASIKMCLSESVSGLSFCGSDVGGYIGTPELELFERWFQAAIYQPFFRSHSNFFAKLHKSATTTDKIIQNSIMKRYSYLPFWYTMFYEHEIFGLPIMRPLLANYPSDIKSFEIDEEYLLQDRLLICPIMDKNIKIINIYFPSGEDVNCFDIWYDINTYEKYDKSGYESIYVYRDRIPVFQRGGSIIPKKERVRRSSKLMFNDPYTLVICLNENEFAIGTLFIDDEKSYNYRQGNYIYIQYEFNNNKLINKFINDPNYITKSWLERIVIVGLKNIPKNVTLTTFSNTLTTSNSTFTMNNNIDKTSNNTLTTLNSKLTISNSTLTNSTLTNSTLTTLKIETKIEELKIINDNKSITIRKPGINMSEKFVITLIY